jgi:hypothetical protein
MLLITGGYVMIIGFFGPSVIFLRNPDLIKLSTTY